MSFRWGIAGYGWVAQDYMRPALEAAGGQVAAIADPSPGAQAQARAMGIGAFDDVDALLSATELDALYVATPNNLHAPAVVAAASAGVPVLCEKPVAATLSDAEEIAGAVAGKRYGTAFDQRWHPAHRAIAQAVEAGAIGRTTAMRIAYCCWVDPVWSRGGEPNWRADAAAAGGGAVIDLALHGLDLAQMLVASPLRDLHITLQRRVHDYPVDDGGLLSGRCVDGTLVQLHVAYNCPEGLPRRRLELLGEHGMIVAENTMGQTPGGRVTLIDGATGEGAPIAFDETLSPFTAQAAAFQAYVREGGVAFSIDRDITLMRLFAAAHDEARAWL